MTWRGWLLARLIAWHRKPFTMNLPVHLLRGDEVNLTDGTSFCAIGPCTVRKDGTVG